jgi:hypothetical protein
MFEKYHLSSEGQSTQQQVRGSVSRPSSPHKFGNKLSSLAANNFDPTQNGIDYEDAKNRIILESQAITNQRLLEHED